MPTEVDRVMNQIRQAIQESWNANPHDTFGAFLTGSAKAILAIKVGKRTLRELIEQELARPALTELERKYLSDRKMKEREDEG